MDIVNDFEKNTKHSLKQKDTNERKVSGTQGEIVPFPPFTGVKRPSISVHQGCDAHTAGLYSHTLNKKNEPVDTKIGDPIDVAAQTLDTNGDNPTIIVKFLSRRNTWKTITIPGILRAENMRDFLSASGYYILNGYSNRVQDYLFSTISPEQFHTTTDKIGWATVNGESILVRPNETIQTDPDKNKIFYYPEKLKGSAIYRRMGLLEDWKDNIESYLHGNAALTVGVSTAFVGIMLKTLGTHSFGLNFYGASSTGKSTLLQCAHSIHGSFKDRWVSFNSTKVGLEFTASFHNDGFVGIDELSEGSANNLKDLAYLLSSGIGRTRGQTVGGIVSSAEKSTWNISYLTTSEKSLETKLSHFGIEANAGELVRFLQVPIFETYGGFTNIHKFEQPAEFAEYLERSSHKYYGTAGYEFSKKIHAEINHPSFSETKWRDRINELTNLLLFDGALSQERRAIQKFATILFAGELAIKYSIFTQTPDEIFNHIERCVVSWLDARGRGDIDSIRIREILSAYIDKYAETRFTERVKTGSKQEISIIDSDKTDLEAVQKHNSIWSGYWQTRDGQREWLISSEVLMEDIFHQKGFGKKQIHTTLKKHGWIGDSITTPFYSHRVGMTKRFHVIRIKSIDEEDGVK